MTYIYYLLQRPPAPGAFPKPQGNRVIDVCSYDTRLPVDGVGCPVWGWVRYEKPVSPYLLQRYDMAASGAEIENPCEGCTYMEEAFMRDAAWEDRWEDPPEWEEPSEEDRPEKDE